MAKNRDEKIEELIFKVAKGFQIAEVTEEFVENDGEMKLVKRKKIRKEIPPDWKALQLLLGGADDGDLNLSAMSDEALELERERLLKELQAKCGTTVAVGANLLEENEDACAENGDGELGGGRKARAKPRRKRPTVLNGGKK